jgi:hypothetical protein
MKMEAVWPNGNHAFKNEHLAAIGSGANRRINTGRDIQINFPFH